MRQGLGRLPHKIVADSGYGSEENYAYLEKNNAENFVKYNTFGSTVFAKNVLGDCLSVSSMREA